MKNTFDTILGILFKLLFALSVALGVYGGLKEDSKLLFFAIIGLFTIGVFGIIYLLYEKIISFIKSKK